MLLLVTLLLDLLDPGCSFRSSAPHRTQLQRQIAVMRLLARRGEAEGGGRVSNSRVSQRRRWRAEKCKSDRRLGVLLPSRADASVVERNGRSDDLHRAMYHQYYASSDPLIILILISL